MLPDLFNDSVVDAMDSNEFSRRWDELMRTWMPTIEQLGLMTNNDIEAMAFAPLPLHFEQHEFILAIRRRNLVGLEHGYRQGWWQAYTTEGPLPAARRVTADDYAGKTMAHVMADVGFFPSVGQARKNGWDRPVETGRFKVGKNNVIEIV
jgi:hypothetical protein